MKYYIVTPRLKNKNNFSYDERTQSYTFDGRESNLSKKCYSIDHVYEYVNCGIFVWEVEFVNEFPTDTTHKSKHIILRNCKDLLSFVVENNLYEVVTRNSHFKCYFDESIIPITNNIIKIFPHMVKKILPPNIDSARQYAELSGEHCEAYIYEQALIKATTVYPQIIQYLENIPHNIAKIAVEKDGNCIQYVKKQSLDLCIIAVEQYSYAIRYIEEPNQEIGHRALEHTVGVFEYFPEYLKTQCREYYDTLVDKQKKIEEKKRKQKQIDDEERVRRNESFLRLVCLGAQDVYLSAPSDTTFFKTSYHHK